MIAEAFLICAMSLPSPHFNQRPVISYQLAKSEQERLVDWIRKNNPEAEVFIHPNPHRERLKEYGFEKVPFTWRGNEIWIQRKPKSDSPQKKAIEASA